MLWEHASPNNKDHNAWKESFKELCSFKTVEQFWQYYNHLPKPSNVFFTMIEGRKTFTNRSDKKIVEEYSLFKKGIEPEWGAPQNRIGGEFFCRGNMEPDMLNAYWHNLVMAVVGEYLEGMLCTCGGCANALNSSSSASETCVESECICKSIVNGVRVVDKSKNYPMYKLELWVNTKDPAIKERLRTKLLDVVTEGLPNARKLQFEWKDHKV